MKGIQTLLYRCCEPPLELPCIPKIGVCCVSGEKTFCIPRKYAIKDTFTNGDLLRAPSSDMVSVEWFQVLGYSTGEHKYPFRQGNWVVIEDANGNVSILYPKTKSEILEIVRHPPDGIWGAYVTTSYKKHGALWTRLNRNGSNIWTWETNIVDCSDLALVEDIIIPMLDMYSRGASRKALEIVEYDAITAKNITPIEWLLYERKNKTRSKSLIYQFLASLIPAKEKEPKDEGGEL